MLLSKGMLAGKHHHDTCGSASRKSGKDLGGMSDASLSQTSVYVGLPAAKC